MIPSGVWAALGSALAGCALVAVASCAALTGFGSDSYQLAPIEGGLVQDGGGCEADAPCAVVSLGCASAADCEGGAGGGQVCCLELTSLTSAATLCQATSCPAGGLGIQLCAASTECADASCVSQQCSFGGLPVRLSACGLSPECTP